MTKAAQHVASHGPQSLHIVSAGQLSLYFGFRLSKAVRSGCSHPGGFLCSGEGNAEAHECQAN